MNKVSLFISTVQHAFSLTDDNGNRIPVIFRPRHEHTGGWFFRGTPNTTPEQYRILWTFSAAYRTTGKPEYEEAAMRARDYLLSHFVDEEQGGVFWSVTPQGEPLDTKKRSYAIAFAIYGLAEHFRATGDQRSLDMAVRLYHDIESHSRDHAEGAYTRHRSWWVIRPFMRR